MTDRGCGGDPPAAAALRASGLAWAIRRGALALLLTAAALLAVLALGILLPRGAGEPGTTTAGGAREIVLVAGPIHTDIALPAEPAVLERLGFLRSAGLPLDRADVGHVLVGWGGRTFYTQTPSWGDLTAEAVLMSLTRDRSVLHFVLAPELDPALPGTRRIIVGDTAFEALLDFVEASLTRGGDGAPMEIEGAGYSRFDRFFEAEGAFNLALGCNTWTASALRHAGLRTGVWTPLPNTLFWSLDLHAG